MKANATTDYQCGTYRRQHPIKVTPFRDRWVFTCELCAETGSHGRSLFAYASAGLAGDAGRYHLNTTKANLHA